MQTEFVSELGVDHTHHLLLKVVYLKDALTDPFTCVRALYEGCLFGEYLSTKITLILFISIAFFCVFLFKTIVGVKLL